MSGDYGHRRMRLLPFAAAAGEVRLTGPGVGVYRILVADVAYDM